MECGFKKSIIHNPQSTINRFTDITRITTNMDPSEQLEIETRIAQVLKSIYDPEIPVNIYDLGLVYDISIDDDHIVQITMTLTAPNCPMAEDLVEEVRYKVAGTKGVMDCKVKLTFSPPWDKSMLSDEARLELGFL